MCIHIWLLCKHINFSHLCLQCNDVFYFTGECNDFYSAILVIRASSALWLHFLILQLSRRRGLIPLCVERGWLLNNPSGFWSEYSLAFKECLGNQARIQKCLKTIGEGGEMKYLWDPSGSAKGYYKLMINHIVTPCA